MNKYYLLLLTVLLFVFACQKTDKPVEPIPVNQEKFAVNIKVPEFTYRLEPNAKVTDSSLSRNATMLIYTVFPINTITVYKQIIQYNTDSTFGHFTDSLPTGRYLITVTAVKDTAYVRFKDGGYTLYLIPPGTDVFFNYVKLNVDSEVNNSITLNRAVAKLVYELKGRVPTNAASIDVSPMEDYEQTPYIKNVFHLTGGIQRDPYVKNTIYTYHIPDSLHGAAGITFDQYLFCDVEDEDDISYTFTARTDMLYPIAEDEAYFLTTRTNWITYISGNLFDSIPSGGGMQVTLSDKWYTDTLKF